MLTFAALVAWGLLPVPDRLPDGGPRASAQALHAAGLDAMMRMDGDSVFRAMQQALEADPTFLPALVDLAQHFGSGELLAPDQRSAVVRLAERWPADLGLCVVALLGAGEGTPEPALHEPARGTPSPCAHLAVVVGPRHVHPPLERALAAGALHERFPESPTVLSWRLEALGATGEWDRLQAVARSAMRRGSPALRLTALAHDGAALHAQGRHEEAAYAEERALAEAQAVGPGAEYAVLSSLHLNAAAYATPGTVAHLDSVAVEKAARTRRLVNVADPSTRLALGLATGEHLLNQGRLVESMTAWDELVHLADSLSIAGWQAESRLRRGRTSVKLGRNTDAERDLLEARDLARRSPLTRPAYETEHNLHHLYEAEGRRAEAIAAGEAFVELTRRSSHAPVRMIAYRDLGWYLRRGGAHARSDSLLSAMVALVDSLGDYHFYAGEYFELDGDLERAAAYYARQSPATQDGVRAAAALVRVAESLADTAEALAAAGRHDARMVAVAPEGRPLLPGVLARSGRVAEAERALGEARARALERGQVAAWARLALDEADLRSGMGDHRAAASLADSAAGAAVTVADHGTALRARAAATLARVRAGADPFGSLPEIRATRAEITRLSMPSLESDAWLAEGEILAAAGAWREADEALDRSWVLADSVARSLALDVARAGYQAARAAITDRALTLVAGRPGPEQAARWLAWSRRRRGYAAAVGRDGGTSALRRSLGADRALVDFAVLPDGVAALVLTDQLATVEWLPPTTGALRDDVVRFASSLAPRVGSRLDLGRARFDPEPAHRLYQGLIAPLEPLLEGRTTLVLLPDGPLHLLPFDALLATPPGSPPVFLVDRFEVLLAAAPNPVPVRPTRPLTVLAVAGPSDASSGGGTGSDEEVALIAEGLGPGRTSLLRGEVATPASVLEAAPRYAVLHLAAHAHPNPTDPSRAFVALSGPDPASSRLYPSSFEGTPLRGSLVVLSGCDTGGGRLLAGEGVMSLGRAFLRAGADGVVATLWPVGAPSAPLVQRFYAELARGGGLSQALRAAKRARAREGDGPVFWAPFIVLYPGV